MRALRISPVPIAVTAVLVAVTLVLLSVATVSAKPPRKPPPTPTPSPSPSAPPSVAATVEVAATGTLAPNRESAVANVTATCPVGWTVSSGSLYILDPARPGAGGAGSFSVPCTGTPQVAQARAVNGNRWTLGDWTATAYLHIQRNGQTVTASSTRTISLQPGVTARVADQGQLTGSAGGGVSIAVAVACPTGSTGQPSSVTVSQGEAAVGTSASFVPTCDGQTRSLVLSITASQGTFHTGSAAAEAAAAVTWNGGTFSGSDNRSITLLQSSTGDTTAPTAPAGLSANTFGDTEVWLTWGASSDNATPTGLIVYEVYLNGRFDQAIGGGFTSAILYADAGVLNTIEVIAVDGAGNRSAPASVSVDLRV